MVMFILSKKHPDGDQGAQRVDKPSHSPAGLRAGTHECQIRSVPVLALPRAAKVFYHAEKKTKG